MIAGVNDLKNKVALVTGGGSGLGKEICLSLAVEGVKVYAGDIDEKKVSSVADIADVGIITPLVINISDEQSIKAAVEKIINEEKRIDILINNAGIDKTKPFEELSTEDIRQVINVDLLGTMLVTRYVYPKMKDQKAGTIVNIASTAAFRAWTEATVYCASKWGVRGFSQALHAEGRRYGIKVSTVFPGGMRTPFILERFPDTPLDKLQPPENVAWYVVQILRTPIESVVPEIEIYPVNESSWP